MSYIAFRKERIDRGIKVRSDDIFILASLRDLMYATLPKGIAVVLLVVFPLLKDQVGTYWENVLVTTIIIALLSLSWDLLSSVGLVSLGQALFFGIGAYLTGWLSRTFELTPLVSIPLATLGGALIATIFLFPVLRLRGIYFGLITFALPLLFARVIEVTKILGGTEGLNRISPLPGLTTELYILIAVLLISIYAYHRLMTSNYGLVLQAIRDNDRAVIAAGIDVQRLKAQAVFLAALPATFAGAFLTHHFQVVGMQSFALDYSILPLTSAIVGGAGSFIGSVLGAFLMIPLSEFLREFASLRVVIYSLLLLVFAVGLPEGIFPYLRRKYQQFERITSFTGEEIKRGN
ncbi:branched-chain amino acid ABC transporter permease [Paradesulfitobacterium aromaticivorans]